MADWLMRTGYVVVALAIVWDSFVVFMRSESYGVWDYVLPVALVLIPLLSIIFVHRWPLVCAIALVAAGLYVGIPISAINVWVAGFYAVPVLLSGLIFLPAAILQLVERRSLV